MLVKIKKFSYSHNVLPIKTQMLSISEDLHKITFAFSLGSCSWVDVFWIWMVSKTFWHNVAKI